jgi:peptidyl-prolyl cis-trans isomerase B (cyclophilin B)
MRKISAISVFSICFIIASSCAQQKKESVVIIKTTYGDMVAILYDETPKHKENFIKLAKDHFYDSTLFHRVIQGFMIQGGDPDSKKATPGQMLGRGGPGYTVEAEFNPKFFHEKGALSAARLADPQNPKKASNGSQFYIVQGRILSEEEMSLDQVKYDRALQKFFENPANKGAYDSLGTAYQSQDQELFRKLFISLKPRVVKETGMDVSQTVAPDKLKAYSTAGGAPMLDGSYTVFGKVIKGLEVIDKIAEVEKDKAERPLNNIPMTVTVEEMSRKKIKEQFGYEYD